MKQAKQSQMLGFTLIELLVVVAIIAVLAGLLLPVFSAAKKQAQVSRDLHGLRQAGIARELYANDHDGLPTDSLVEMIKEGYIAPQVTVSGLDSSVEGFAQCLANSQLRSLGLTSKMSFAAYLDNQVITRIISENESNGWLVSFVDQRSTTQSGKCTMQLPGKYQRLTFSGSVIRRTFSVRATPTGTIEAPSELYTDLGY